MPIGVGKVLNFEMYLSLLIASAKFSPIVQKKSLNELLT